MRSRRLVVVFLILVIVLAGGFQIFWHAFGIENSLRNLILTQLRSVVPGQVEIGRVSLTPGSINFRDVSLTITGKPYRIDAANLRLGFSLFNAIKYNFNPVRFISDVVLEEPVVRISSLPAAKEKKPSVALNFREIEQQYRKQMVNLDFVGQIVLERGKVIWEGPKKETVLVHDLEGWISTTDLSQANMRIQGSIFRSKQKNLLISGMADIVHGKIDSLSLVISDDSLATTIPTLFPQILTIEGGKLYGRLVLREKKNGLLGLDGRLILENGKVGLFKDRFRLGQLNTALTVRDWDVLFDECSLDLQGSPVRLSGRVLNIMDPHLQLKLESDSLDIGSFLAQATGGKVGAEISGRSRLALSLLGSVSSPEVKGNVSAPHMRWKTLDFSGLRAVFRYRDKMLTLAPFRANFRSVMLVGTAGLDFARKTPRVSGSLRASGDVRPMLARVLDPGVRSLQLQLLADFEANGKTPQSSANFILLAALAGGDSLHLSGKAGLQNGVLTVKVQQPGAPFAFHGNVVPNDGRLQIEAGLQHFGGKLWYLFPLPGRSRFERLVDLNASYTGDQNFATFTLQADRKVYTGESNRLFHLEGYLRRTAEKMEVRSSIAYFPDTGGKIPGEIRIAILPEAWVLEKYRLGDFYSANLRINRTGEKTMVGRFDMNQVDVTYILDGALLEPNFEILGKVNGHVFFSGTLKNPEISGDLALEKGIIRGEGYYTAALQFALKQKKLNIVRAELWHETNRMVDASGHINLASKQLQLRVRGNNVQTYDLLTLIFPPLNFLKSRADFDLQLVGPFADPDLRGKIRCRDGMLFFVHFDQLDMSIGKYPVPGVLANVRSAKGDDGGDSTAVGTLPPGFYIRSAHLVRNREYEMDGEGYFPYSNTRDLKMNIRGKGNAFAVLFSDLDFIRSSSSESEFEWGFGGTYSDVIYTGGKVSLKKGVLKLADVAPKVDNIEVEAELEPANQFLHIRYMTGQIRKHSFTAINSLAPPQIGRSAEPLVIESWGLNFGYLSFRTDKHGVPLHIPGLMEKGEIGWFALEGKGADPYFLVNGPAENPYIRGKILVHNAAVTFPFVEEKGTASAADTSLVEKILESLLWDVTVVPLQDVRYVRKQPALIDNVWINALIDPEISKLHLTGIIADESFRIEGTIKSTRGNIEYLDLNFNVVEFGAEFDRSSIYPIVYGKARTTITDTLGFPSNIYLTLYVYDPDTKQELERGRWSENLRFKLSSDNPLIGTNEGQVLAALGYSIGAIRSRAADVIGMSTEHLLLRPLFRPFERKVERTLGLDLFRIRSRFARNVMDLSVYQDTQIDPRYLIFRSTQIMIGKYLSENLYVVYSGMLEAGLDPRYQEKGIGFKHSFDLEYRISPNLLLELQYNYNSLLLLQKVDRRIQIRHSFVF